jgi:peptidylprolyl isomerase
MPTRPHRSLPLAGLLALSLQAIPPDLVIAPADAPRTPGGVAYRVLQAGQGGTPPAPGDFVKVHFTGWTREGTVFANTRTQDEAPYAGLERLMPGMRECLALMTAGEQRRIWIPEALAFAKGKSLGPVMMDLELLDRVPPPSQAPQDLAGPPPEAQILRSGVAFKVLRPGTGKEHPNRNSWVSVHYSGWTADGRLFDSSILRGTSNLLQLRDTIDGWVEGLQLMVVGERRRFWIPQNRAYRGEEGRPAGRLVFDVELVGMSR